MMNRVAAVIIALAMAAALAGGPAMVYAAAPEKAPVAIKVRVSEKGFLDEKGKLYSAKRVLTVPKDAVVTITFLFGEDLTSLAVGDTHQIAVKSEDGWKQETGSIWIMNRESSLTFRAGENGRTQYRAYCILDCIGMEHLTNLIIQVAAT
ncbi:MAG: hypothetical protein Q7U39_03190 [Nitrospira sp.]|nr:hypothetical protein [Nitrospira sp.]